MKILHIADVHLDRALSSTKTFEDNRQKQDARNKELYNNFASYLDNAIADGVEVILLCGDIFDRPRIKTVWLDLFLGKIRTHNLVRFYYLSGNHCDDIMTKDSNLPSNLFCFNSDYTSYIEKDNIVITGIELKTGKLEQAPILDKDKFNIVMVHGEFNRSLNNLRLLKNVNADYIACGDAHRTSAVTKLDDRASYAYPGVFEGSDFGAGESGEKGAYILTVNNGKYKTEFVFNKQSRQVINKQLDITALTLEEIEQLIQSELEGRENDLVRLVLKGTTKIETNAIDKMVNRHLFENSHYVLQIISDYIYLIELSEIQEDYSFKTAVIKAIKESDCDEKDKSDLYSYLLEKMESFR
jgi:DNA repair exonuclease SbcCD nuclease subunit